MYENSANGLVVYFYRYYLYYTFSISNEHIIFFIPNKNVTNHEKRFHQSGPYL